MWRPSFTVTWCCHTSRSFWPRCRYDGAGEDLKAAARQAKLVDAAELSAFSPAARRGIPHLTTACSGRRCAPPLMLGVRLLQNTGGGQAVLSWNSEHSASRMLSEVTIAFWEKTNDTYTSPATRTGTTLDTRGRAPRTRSRRLYHTIAGQVSGAQGASDGTRDAPPIVDG